MVEAVCPESRIPSDVAPVCRFFPGVPSLFRSSMGGAAPAPCGDASAHDCPGYIRLAYLEAILHADVMGGVDEHVGALGEILNRCVLSLLRVVACAAAAGAALGAVADRRNSGAGQRCGVGVPAVPGDLGALAQMASCDAEMLRTTYSSGDISAANAVCTTCSSISMAGSCSRSWRTT